MAQSFNNLRLGKRFRLINFGETYEFIVTDILINDFQVQDVHTLEKYSIQDILKFGKGNDFTIDEY